MKHLSTKSIWALSAIALLSACSQTPREPADIPTTGPIAISGSISAYVHGSAYGWFDADKIGVFALSEEGRPQINLAYKPSKTSPIIEMKGMKMPGKKTGAGEQTLLAIESEKSIGYKKGKHTIYAYIPYSPAAKDIKAIPLPSLVTQEADKGTIMTSATEYTFAYASTSVDRETAAVQSLGEFKSPFCQITLPMPNGFPETTLGKACPSVVVTCDHPIAYADGATIDLTSGKIKGEGVKSITYMLPKGTVIQKGRRGGIRPSAMSSAFIVLQVPFETAKDYTYTFTFEVEGKKYATSMQSKMLNTEGNINMRNVPDVQPL